MSLASHPEFEFIKGDIRDIDLLKQAVSGVDAVVHLAAIVGDPACAKQPGLAEEINWKASVELYDLCCKSDNIERFIFASTCSNYGKMKDVDFVTENSTLSPVSLYAKLKVQFEKYITESQSRPEFVPTALRFATVYGFSPRMRFDLTVNEFTRDLVAGRKLVVFGEQFWRPYCHVYDLANSCVKVLESPTEKVIRNVFNVGNTNENYTKLMVVELIKKYIPDAEIEYIEKLEDPRDYRVNFSKIETEIGFKTTRIVEEGIREIIKVLKSGIISDPYNERYSNS